MDFASSLPGSPAGGGGGSGASTPLQPVSHNQQRDSGALFSALRRNAPVDDARDSSVHDKIHQFNSLTMQSKQLERKTADAALKRAMLGREEAEADMRRYRDEARQLRKQVEEGKERERRVGERLEAVMEKYVGAKKTHAHTQEVWEKEIRRARKETFKAQSALVKSQEELKSSRAAQKSAEGELEREKQRSKSREEEAFTARYKLVGLQELLDQALERVKMLEQEKDAFKMLAKNEEDVARIAAEGMLPLPSESVEEDEDLVDSPRKRRVASLTVVDIKSSAAGEEEIEELTRLWQWERQRADRALELVQFLETECHLKFCSGGKAARASWTSINGAGQHRNRRTSGFKIADAGDLVILSEKAIPNQPTVRPLSPKRTKTEMLREEREKEARRSAVFVPAEGIFRTVSQGEGEEEALNVAFQQQQPSPVESNAPTPDQTVASSLPPSSEPPTPADAMPPVFARTPSVEPPDFAIPAQLPRTSLLSLLDAPHEQEPPLKNFHVPTTPGPIQTVRQLSSSPEQAVIEPSDAGTTTNHSEEPTVETEDQDTLTQSALTEPLPSVKPALADAPTARPHTSTALYPSSMTTTTKVPLRDETEEPSLASRLMKLQRTPSRTGDRDEPSFDVNNPALTPTMTREQALAKIHERRGRARSVGKVAVPTSSSHQSVVTPKRPLSRLEKERREVSAPTGRVAPLGVTPGARRVRS